MREDPTDIGVIKVLRWDQGFVIVPNEFAQDRTISPLTTAFILDAASRCESWKTTTESLARHFDVGRDKARAALMEAVEHGYAYQHVIRDQKRRVIGMDYIVSTSKRALREFAVQQGWEGPEYLGPENPGLAQTADLGPEKPGPRFSGPIKKKKIEPKETEASAPNGAAASTARERAAAAAGPKKRGRSEKQGRLDTDAEQVAVATPVDDGPAVPSDLSDLLEGAIIAFGRDPDKPGKPITPQVRQRVRATLKTIMHRYRAEDRDIVRSTLDEAISATLARGLDPDAVKSKNWSAGINYFNSAFGGKLRKAKEEAKNAKRSGVRMNEREANREAFVEGAW